MASRLTQNMLAVDSQDNKKGQYLDLKSGKRIHVATFVNDLYNKDVTSSSADRLRRTRGDSAVPMPLQEDAADGVLPGTPYCSLLTFKPAGGDAVTSAAIFSYVETRVDTKKVRAPSPVDLVACPTAMVVGEYMPFQDAGDGKLLWTGRYGAEVTVPATAVLFVELQLGPSTRWLVESDTLNAFVDTSKNITTCPALQAEPYPLVHTTSVRDKVKTKPCLFCGVDIALNNMMGHVTNHFLDGDSLQERAHAGEHPMCGFCGATAGKCSTQLMGKKMSSSCPYFYAFRYGSAVKRHANVPRKCPVALCDATHFTLGMAQHLKCAHPNTDVVVPDWKVERATVRKAKKVPKGMSKPMVQVQVESVEVAGAASEVTTTSDGGGDLYGQRRATSSDSDWCPPATDNIDAGSDGSVEKEDNESSSDSEPGSSTDTSSSSSTSCTSSSTPDGMPVVGTGRTKKYTKTSTRISSTQQPSAKPAAKRRTASQPVAHSAKRARQ